MDLYVIILSTTIKAAIDLERIKPDILTFRTIEKWNCDLEDDEKILRVVSTQDVSKHLMQTLEKRGITTQVLGVFKKKITHMYPL